MDIKKKLTNPFALVAQGFALGAVLFFATPSAADVDPAQQSQAAQASAPSKNLGA